MFKKKSFARCPSYRSQLFFCAHSSCSPKWFYKKKRVFYATIVTFKCSGPGHNVTFAAATIDYWVLPYVQATVSAVSEAAASGGNATYELELAPRSAPPSTIIPKLNLANPGHFWKAPNGDVSKAVVSGTVSTCVVPPAGPFPTGLSPCPPVDFSTGARHPHRTPQTSESSIANACGLRFL